MSFVSSVRFSSSPDVDDQAFIAPALKDRLQNYSEPAILFYLSVYSTLSYFRAHSMARRPPSILPSNSRSERSQNTAFIKVVLSTILFNPTALFPFSKVRSRAFAETWMLLGSSNGSVGPLKNIVPLFNSASGIVLDIGPGDGRQLVNYTNPGIKALYGAEPCVELHPGLQIAAKKAGLGDKLTILNCGAQRKTLVPKLQEVGLLRKDKVEGVFDTVVCSKVLCSVPNQRDTVAGLYALLKPGGRLIVCEHVRNPWRTPKGSVVARAIQELIMMQGWSWFLSGCQLTRNTDEVVKGVADADGGWGKVDLEYVVLWGTIPYVLGELVKKG
jgi:SAM-dependent methyltransferase